MKPLPFVCAHCTFIYNRVRDFRIDAWGIDTLRAVDDYLQFKTRGTDS